MATSDWILIFTALFLGACALFVPYFAEIVKRWKLAPELKILFELASPFCHKTSFRPPPTSQIQFEEPAYYFRFQVVNEGKTQAKLCETVLENLWIYDAANIPRLYPNFSPINMIWVGSSNEFININPKRKIFCDIGHISSASYQEEIEQKKLIDIRGYTGTDLRFVIDQFRIFYSQPNCLAPGRYILEVALYSENAGCQREFFDISWSGKCKDGEDEMFREIVITRTNSPRSN